MESIKNMINVINEKSLEDAFNEELKDKDFKELVQNISCNIKDLYKYRSNLKDTVSEYKNCRNCKGLLNCKNGYTGYLYFPEYNNGELLFSYIPCKYKKQDIKENKYLDNIDLFEVPKSIKEAKMKDIYIDDKSRVEIIKYINNFYENYFKDKGKGLYLSGSFGSGKTFIISALFNELAKRDVKSVIIYFPEFLRKLKSSFGNKIEFDESFNHIKKSPLLLIDDIGAEQVTSWSRDEILGTILQYRMEENLPTFFTSNLNINELEEHLSSTKEKVEKLKARRIIERIKYLTNEMELIGVDRRK